MYWGSIINSKRKGKRDPRRKCQECEDGILKVKIIDGDSFIVCSICGFQELSIDKKEYYKKMREAKYEEIGVHKK